MKPVARQAFTLVELLTVIAIIALLIGILMPALGRAREQGNRTVCSANMKAVLQGLQTFATEFNGKFPTWHQPKPGFATMGMAWGTAADLGDVGLVDTESVCSNTRNLWMLVHRQMAIGKVFTCPSDPELDEPWDPADPRAVHDFQNRSQLSYSFQYQGPGSDGSGNPEPAWNTTLRDDARLVVLADKSPMLEADNPTTTDAEVGCEFAPGGTLKTPQSFTDAMQNLEPIIDLKGKFQPNWKVSTTAERDLESLNSQNHRGEGQVVARLDGSAGWIRHPWAGAANDLIWTVQNPTDIQDADQDVALAARAHGAFGTIFTNEDFMLAVWYAEPRWNRREYPDSFLVP